MLIFFRDKIFKIIWFVCLVLSVKDNEIFFKKISFDRLNYQKYFQNDCS